MRQKKEMCKDHTLKGKQMINSLRSKILNLKLYKRQSKQR